MYHIKDDQRSIRSSELIYHGLVKIMREKEYSLITVTDLVESAKVGRTTFYRNFDEIEDVLRMRCDQVVNGLVDYILEYRQDNPGESRAIILKPILRYFYLHSELIELLLKAKRVEMFEEFIRSRFAAFKPMLRAHYGLDDDYLDYVMAMRVGGITNILTHWVETGKKQAPDELANKLSATISNMVALEQFL